MNDQITPEQKKAYIFEALVKSGFGRVNEMEIFTKEHDGKKIIVADLTAGKSVVFKEGTTRISTDDEEGTLLNVSRIITDAEGGKMPTKSDADEVVNVPTRSDTPPPKSNESEVFDPPEPKQDPTGIGNVPAVPEPAQACAPQTNNLLDLIQKYVGNDVLQVFGDTGAGKSKFCFEVAMQAIAAGKKVYYLDTERNLTDADVAHLKGCDYQYTPVLDEIDKIVQKLPAVDVVILDSIGFPVLTTYARLSMKQKGDALLQLIAIFGDLKTWAYKNNGVAVVTNQPESEFNKEKGHIFRPFGDKSQFACKEIWKTKIKTRGASETNILIEAFRSRSVGFGTKIATMKITDTGVEVSA